MTLIPSEAEESDSVTRRDLLTSTLTLTLTLSLPGRGNERATTLSLPGRGNEREAA